MKLLTLNANLQGVGTYLRCYYFSRELARRGHEVTMATVSRTSVYRPTIYYKNSYLTRAAAPSGPGPWIRMVEGPSLGNHWLPGWGSGPLDIAWRTKELLRGGYDLVYAFEYQPNVGWPFYITRVLRSVPLVSDWCDWHSGQSNWFRGCRAAHRIDAFFEERIRFFAQAVTVISRTLFERAARIGIDPARILHVPEGVDTEYLHMFPKGITRLSLKVPVDRPIVLSVKDSDMERCIRIFHLVLKHVPNAIYVIVGSIGEGPRKQAETLGINGSILWAGRVPDDAYPKYLSCADVCLLPLRNNTLNRARVPAKLLDYFASGRPVVTNAVGDISALLTNNRVSVAADQDDHDIAESVVTLLRDPELAEHLGSAARRLMVNEWDWRLRGGLIGRACEC